jgi:hypothetical protein
LHKSGYTYDWPLPTNDYRRLKSPHQGPVWHLVCKVMVVLNLCDWRGGALLKHVRLLLLTVTAAVLSTATWADGIDPKVIIQKGTDSTPITIHDPNPSVTAISHANTEANPCFLAESLACISDIFQNQTGITIHSLTIGITDVTLPEIGKLVFSCGASTDLLFFNHCSSSDNGSVTDIFFSNAPGSPFHGVDSAVLQCGDDGEEDDCHNWVGGEFSVDIEGADLPAGIPITVQAITTPEPGSGMMILCGALAFALIKLVRRGLIRQPIQ